MPVPERNALLRQVPPDVGKALALANDALNAQSCKVRGPVAAMKAAVGGHGSGRGGAG